MDSRFLLFVVCTGFMNVVRGEISYDSGKQSVVENDNGKFMPLFKNCSKFYSVACFKIDITKFLDKLSTQKDFGILPGVSIVKEEVSEDLPIATVLENITRDYPDDVEKRIDAFLMHKAGHYLRNHAISIKLFDPKTFEAADDFNKESLDKVGFQGRKKDKGGMNNMMTTFMMLKGTLGALGFGTLAMLAGKALMTGLMALMLSAIVGLKSLSGGHGKSATYEIITKPVYSSGHSQSTEEIHPQHFGTSGYGRSLDDVHQTVQEAVQIYGNVLNRRSVA